MTTRTEDQRTLGEDGRPLPETSAPYAAKVLAERLIEYGPEELAPYHRNPRRGDVDAIAASLRRNGQYRPIVVNLGTHTGRPLEVLAGNHTLAAARQLGWDRIAATTVDVDDHQAARIVAADNRTADLGGYDDDVLLELLQELPDLEGTGYNDDNLTRLLEYGALDGTDDEGDEVQDDADTSHHATETGDLLELVDVTVDEPVAQTTHGQTWTLGRHTLVVAKVMAEHHLWRHLLTDDMMLCPYPDPYLTHGNLAADNVLLMIQPSNYLAGHTIDKFAAFYPDAPITCDGQPYTPGVTS